MDVLCCVQVGVLYITRRLFMDGKAKKRVLPLLHALVVGTAHEACRLCSSHPLV